MSKKSLDELKQELLNDPQKQAVFRSRIIDVLKDMGLHDDHLNNLRAPAHGDESKMIVVSKTGSSKSETAVIW